MQASTGLSSWRAATAFLVAPAAWAVHQQASYSLVPVTCREQWMFIPALTLAAFAAIALGAFVSWRVRTIVSPIDTPLGRAQRFLANLGLLMSALIALAVFLQGGATLILNGCQRW